MTKLTQADLDEMRMMTMAYQRDELIGISKATVVALLDHIAQLTAERDEARKEFAAAQGTADDNYKRWCDAQGRMAQLESASPDLAWFWVIVDRHGLFHEAPSDELDALAWICNTLNRAEARIAELEAQSSAQFVAGMQEVLKEILKATDFIGSGVVDWRTWIEDAQQKARSILAEAALKGEAR